MVAGRLETAGTGARYRGREEDAGRDDSAVLWSVRGLSGAERQQDFLAERVFEVGEVEGRLALVTEDLEHLWPAFLGHVDPGILHVHDVHLKRLDQEVPFVAATRTGERHQGLLDFERSLAVL